MRTKLIHLSTAICFFIAIFLTSCSDEHEENNYYYQASTESKMDINDGMKLVDRDTKKEFNHLYDNVIEMCNSDRMGIISNAQIFLEQPEYKELLHFFEAQSTPYVYYLLMDKYLQCEHGVVPYMFVDIVKCHYKGIVETAEEKAEVYSSPSVHSYQIFPSICVEMLINQIKHDTKALSI